LIAFDTNALIRMLIEDNPIQANIVKDIITEIEKHSDQIMILSEVLIETVWVLESAYHCTREEISQFLEILMKTPSFILSDPLAVSSAVSQYKKGGDFADHVIVNKAKLLRANKMFSFDKKLQKKFPGYVVESIEINLQ